jgi:predicted nucleic acid-binding protein
MITYADSSVLIAWFHPSDEFAKSVTLWARDNSSEFLWNWFLRAEVRHNLRRLKTSYARTAWNAYQASESGNKLKLNKTRLTDLLRRADELSSQFSSDTNVGTWDFVHVAAALDDRAECFAKCDEAQAVIARKAELPLVKLFKP